MFLLVFYSVENGAALMQEDLDLDVSLAMRESFMCGRLFQGHYRTCIGFWHIAFRLIRSANYNQRLLSCDKS